MAVDLPSYNLLDEGWIPCLRLEVDGRAGERPAPRMLGLTETLTEANRIVEIEGDTPLETVSIIRLLLAILYRCVDVSSMESWRTLWESRRFPKEAIDVYLERHRQRFDLFDAARPFYQCASVPMESAGTVSKLLYQADNNTTLFDHAIVASPPALRPDKVARSLLVIQAFDTSGTKSGNRAEKIAPASPLVQSAVIVFRGSTLFETLMLNLCRYSPDRDGEPWEFRARDDLPAWERDASSTADDRMPSGFCDLLTWQSRRALVRPEFQPDGAVVVRHATVMKGAGLAAGFERRNRETMLAFRQAREPKASESAWYPMRFVEDRALWRDCLALFSSVPDDSSRSKGSQWLAALQDEGVLPRRSLQPVDVYGLATEKAKCLFWRHEQMTIPASLVADENAGWRVKDALDIAERVAPILSAQSVRQAAADGRPRTMASALAVLAWGLVKYEEDLERSLAGLRPAQRRRLARLIAELSPGRRFWANLAMPFQQFLEDLSASVGPGSHTDATSRWRGAVRTAAIDAFGSIAERVGVRGHALRAVAVGDRIFRHQLKLALEDDSHIREGGTHDGTTA